LVKERFKRSLSRESLRTATPVRDTVISLKKLEKTPKPDISWTRFYNFSQDVTNKKLDVLYPNTQMVTKNQNSQPFAKYERTNPFVVKPEHATRCQH